MLSSYLLLLRPIYTQLFHPELLRLPCQDGRYVGKSCHFRQTGVSAFSLRLTSCQQTLISSSLFSSSNKVRLSPRVHAVVSEWMEACSHPICPITPRCKIHALVNHIQVIMASYKFKLQSCGFQQLINDHNWYDHHSS